MRIPKKFWLILVLAVFTVPAASENPGRQSLTHDVYDSWKSIRSEAISPDGQWLLYLEAPQQGDAEVIVKKIDGEITYNHTIGYTGEDVRADQAARPAFCADSRYVFFLVSAGSDTVLKITSKKNKKDLLPKKALGIMNLENGSVELIEEVKSWSAPEESGGMVAYLFEKPEEKKNDKAQKEQVKEEITEEVKTEAEPEKAEEEKRIEKKIKERKDKKEDGTMLAVRFLYENRTDSIPFVHHYQFTKNGEHLIYTVSAKDTGHTDGVYALAKGAEQGRMLLSGDGDYKRLALNKDETVLAFLTNKDEWDSLAPSFDLYGWQIGSKRPAELWVSHKTTRGFPEKMAVSDQSGIHFSDDGSVVLFGIKEITEPETDEDEKEEAQFELWHWNDPYPYPQQQKMEKQVRDNTWQSVYDVRRKRFTRLADETLPDVSLHSGGSIAFGQTNWPYAKKVSYFGRFNDVYIVCPESGNKTLVREKLFGSGASLSSDGKYVIWYEDGDWFVYDIKSARTKNITEGLEVSFAREDHDRPEPAYSWGMAGWAKNDESVFIYDRYDIWEISPDGRSRRMITNGYGRENDLSFRYVRLDPDETWIDTGEPMLLSATNLENMASGFYQIDAKGLNRPRRLVFDNKIFSRPEKAEKADRLLFTRQAFNEYPDLWVSDMAFSNIQKQTGLGAQTDPFIWGSSELVAFYSADGKPLKGILVKPDDFDPDKKYPLMVYIYETLHSGLHRFRAPSPGTSINPSYYVSNGYVLWMPDIVYGTGYPGQDALKCVLPGIQMLVREGFVDPEAIGIHGHSWGGYQISYMITQTDIFKACVAGAPVSNMVSAYGGIRWGTGMVRQFQYEKTQSRLGGTLWEVPLRYIENSPVFWADKVNTPVMMLHNDQDGAVPWYQGIEFIMALRRLEREAYMINYTGGDHGLRKRVNQKDWTVRMAEFFDHHLKGAEMPDWMKYGIKAWEK